MLMMLMMMMMALVLRPTARPMPTWTMRFHWQPQCCYHWILRLLLTTAEWLHAPLHADCSRVPSCRLAAAAAC